MTWLRRHCIQCMSDMEDCDICGCHPSPAELRANLALDSTAGGEKKAPATLHTSEGQSHHGSTERNEERGD